MAGMQKTRVARKTNGYYLPVAIIEALRRQAWKHERSDSAELTLILRKALKIKKAA